MPPSGDIEALKLGGGKGKPTLPFPYVFRTDKKRMF